MIRSKKYIGAILAAGLFILSACTPKAAPTVDSNTVYTQVAGTVQADMTKAAAQTPSATPTTEPTATTEATQAPTAAEVSPTVETSPIPVFTATRPAAPDKAEYVSQSVADNTKLDPGKQFTITWKMKNVGTSTWTTAYLLRFYSGDQMKAPATSKFPKEVKPGDTVELSVAMTAPSTAGTYRGDWVLTNADGINFSPIFIQIVVGNAPTATITVVPSATSAVATATSAPPTETSVPPTATTAP